MLKRFINFFKSSSPAVTRWLYPEAEVARWEMPDPQVYGNQADLYRKLSDIGTVIDAVANSCAEADFDIVDADGVEYDDHPLALKLERPNEYDSRTEFMRAHYSWRKITGNSYWFLNRPSAKVAPDEIWILPPSKIIPVPDGKMGLRGYLYYPGNGAEIPLEPYEVIHFKSFNPFNRWLGLSAVESLGIMAYGSLAAQEWNTRLFAENNARLPGILAFAEMVNDSDWEKLKKDVADSAKKRNQMMLRGVGQGGVNWMQGASSQKDMEFLAGLDHTTRQIYDRLAPGFYNILTPNATLANGGVGLTTFGRMTIIPLLRETTDKINAELIGVYGEGYKSEYEDVTPEDKVQKLAEIAEYSKYHTLDEVRVEMYGDEPHPNKAIGGLLPVQITANTGTPEPTPPAPTTLQAQPAPEAAEPAAPEDDEMKADLRRWKKKATKNIGTPRALEFDSDYIPAEMAASIRGRLPACKSADDVALLFDGANTRSAQTSEILALAAAIEKAAESA